MEILEGKLVRFLWRNDDGSWGIAVIQDSDGQEHKVVGGILAGPGDMVKASGEWIDHPKFGPQFKVKSLDYGGQARDRDGIVGYLERLPGVGPVRAATIYRQFGADTFDVIENAPDRLTEAPGVTVRMVDAIHGVFMAEKSQRDLIVFLKRFELTDRKIAKIIGQYGKDAARVVREDPYRLIQDIHGFGFKIVDSIALAGGMKRNDPQRIRAGLNWVLENAETEGHVFLPADTLVKEAARALQAPSGQVKETLEIMVADGDLVAADGGLYLPGLYRAEIETAGNLERIMEEAA